MLKQKIRHSPTLNTVIMVEGAIKNSNESTLTVAELKRQLPKQVNHNTLILILHYLEESNKIMVGMKGITWIHNSNKNLKKEIEEGLEI